MAILELIRLPPQSSTVTGKLVRYWTFKMKWWHNCIDCMNNEAKHPSLQVWIHFRFGLKGGNLIFQKTAIEQYRFHAVDQSIPTVRTRNARNASSNLTNTCNSFDIFTQRLWQIYVKLWQIMSKLQLGLHNIPILSEWQGKRMIGHGSDENIPINEFLKWNVPWAIWLHLVLKKSNGCNLWRLTSSNPGRFRAGLYQSRKWENQQRINYSVARVINGAFQEWRMKIKLLGLHSSQSTEQLAGSIGGWHMPGPITGWSNRPLWLPSCACSLLSSDP